MPGSVGWEYFIFVKWIDFRMRSDILAVNRYRPNTNIKLNCAFDAEYTNIANSEMFFQMAMPPPAGTFPMALKP